MVNQLPAYLQNRQSRTVTERAVAGLGISMPPHISIQGNSFTLIDAAGNEQNEGSTIDVCIVDLSDTICKRYYGNKPWTPDSNDPPVCFSANGIGPSRDAPTPQHAICATCPHNERGSAISKISGASIKACRDEKWLAILPLKYPTMLFQLVLTPGSFKNWKAFLKPFEEHGAEISNSITRISFEPKVNGVLQFTAAQNPQGAIIWIDENIYKARETALASKATDILVGRNDLPREGVIAAPQGALQIEQRLPVEAPQAEAFFAAGTAVPAVQTRRRRNTAEAPQPAPQTAPFMVEQPTAQPQTAFGMAQGTAPNAELQNTLNSLFGKK